MIAPWCRPKAGLRIRIWMFWRDPNPYSKGIECGSVSSFKISLNSLSLSIFIKQSYNKALISQLIWFLNIEILLQLKNRLNFLRSDPDPSCYSKIVAGSVFFLTDWVWYRVNSNRIDDLRALRRQNCIDCKKRWALRMCTVQCKR